MRGSEVDLVVVQDHTLAEQIVKALKHAGIHHVEFWPEHMLNPTRAYSGAPLMRGFFRAPKFRTSSSARSTSACPKSGSTRRTWRC